MSPQADAAARAAREREHFDQLADEVGEVWWGNTTPFGYERTARRVRLLTARLDRLQEPHCVEIGAGRGTFTERVLEARPNLHVTALDLSPRQVDLAKARLQRFPHLNFGVGDASRLPCADRSVDAVFGVSILHHVDLEPVLAEMRRVLRPGGVIWFSEPNMLNPQVAVEKNVRVIGRWLQNSDDETAFIRQPLSRRLQRAGFDGVVVRPFDFMHPGLPAFLISPMRAVNAVLEHTPLIKEISGSLEIVARRP
jgi:ubiquinone/menaquinone biosynthesis C-methylase UbiE